MHVPWAGLELLVAIAESGSLTGAARNLGTTQPTVSRRLAELEAALGATLFVRRVDGIVPTSLADRLLPAARAMAAAATETVRALNASHPLARAVVRVTAPPGLAATWLAGFAARLRAARPDVALEVVATPRYVDLARREADLAIRADPAGGRTPRGGELVRVATASGPIRVYVAAAYRSRLRRGAGVADLDWIAWTPELAALPPNPQLAALIPGFRPAFAADDYLVQLAACAAGVGAMALGPVLPVTVPPEGLLPLDLDLGRESVIHVLSSRGALAIPRVRAVADLLTAELARGRRLRRG